MFYAIEYCCTWINAQMLYDAGGIDGHFYSDNPWEFDDDKDVFDNEEDARKAWKERGCDQTYIWEDECLETDPAVGLTLYALSRYDDDGTDKTLEMSTCVLTPEEIREMFPNHDFTKDD